MAQALLQETIDAFTIHGTQMMAAASLGVPRTTFDARLNEARRRKVLPSSHLEDLNNPVHLRAKLRRVEGELKTANETVLDHTMIKAKIIGLTQNVAEVEPPKWLFKTKSTHDSPGVPTLFLSDLHWGEVIDPKQIGGVNTYNMAIARARLKEVGRSAIRLLTILSPKLDYPGIVVILGGDLISGNLHEELTATNEMNTMPTVLDLFEHLAALLQTMADTFGHVFVPVVSGNHGRATHKTWGKDRHHTSFDWLTGCLLAKHFANDERFTFLIPDGPDAYYRVYTHKYLLSHGDQFRGGDGVIGALGPIIRGDYKKRSRNAQIGMDYDTLLIGHFHQYISLTKLIVNGSLKGLDEYAYSLNFPYEPPQQALWLNHWRHGITYRMPILAAKREVEAGAAWVSVKK